MSPRARLLLTTAALAVPVFLLPPIAQPPQDHDFADQRPCGLLPNCLDTASNALFVLAGLSGLRILLGAPGQRAFAAPREAWPYALFFLAVFDLRPYLFMQIAPILLTPLLLWLYPPRYSGGLDILVVVGLYLLALLLDLTDRPIFALSNGLVSGHTLKHVVAALATLWVVKYLHSRRRN